MGFCPKTFFEMLFPIIFLLLSLNIALAKRECLAGMESLGYTYPRGDISIRYGEPLDIYCTLNEEKIKEIGPNATNNIIFRRNGQSLSREMVKVLNSSTVWLHVEKPDKTNQDSYICIYRKEKQDKQELRGEQEKQEYMVCMNLVYIGVSPQPVVDFNCISNNLDKLTCNWTAPDNNVATFYNLSYSLKTSTIYNCPRIEESEKLDNGKTKMSCMWSLSTDPIYRQSVPDYYFYLNMSNAFGSLIMPRKHFKHFEHVKPNAPEHLRILGTTWNSVNLSWTVPTTMQSFSKGLYHRILYQSAYGVKEWLYKDEPLFRKDVREVNYTLGNLEFAHAVYDIRVSLRSAAANAHDEKMWSDNASITVFTASKRPDYPPYTDVGSFEILTYGNNSDRNVRIYWSDIPEEMRNGENFSYVVKLEGQEALNVTDKAYMLFERLLSHKNYTFHIWAKNEMGYSEKRSVVRIPRHKDCAKEPTRLTKEEFGGGHYRLSWQPPELEPNQIVTNYTIFWCDDERDRPPCSGTLNWEVIPGSQTSHNQSIPSNKTYQFAIAANTKRGSSGMTWAYCTDIYHKYSVGRIVSFDKTGFGQNWVGLQWSFGCSDKSVTGFIIYYCPIKSPEKSTCREDEKIVSVSNNKTTAIIHNLAPYTTYSFNIAAVINYTGYSQKKDLLVTTWEAAPSTPPKNLKVTNVTNSSITITWQPPEVTNGKLKDYIISFNNETKIINPGSSRTLTNLTSYKNYEIKLQACTVECSKFSETLKVQTKIGYPTVIRKPYITQNDSFTTISWEKPYEPNGRNEYYELKIKEKHDYENFTTIFNTTSREWGIYSCGKEKKYTSFYVSVRAVNIDNNEIFHGKWSDEVESYCRSPSNYIIYVLVPAIILFLLAMTFLFKKIYNHFEAMRDVGVKLPQGLQAEAIETEMNLSNWSEKPPNDIDQHSDDQERLLNKKTHQNSSNTNLNNGGDSSGCSSARDESSAFSIETASNASSDSGTENLRQNSIDEEMIAEIGLTTTNLRQRNVGKPYVAFPTMMDNANAPNALTANASAGKTKNYCVLGVDTVIDGPSSYIPLPLATLGDKSDTSHPHSPPYVLTGELVKTANPNYVPFKVDNGGVLSLKNPAYVVAGHKDLMTPSTATPTSPVDLLEAGCKRGHGTSDEREVIVVGSWCQSPKVVVAKNAGYVSIGELPQVDEAKEAGKGGYMPHRQFESLKED